MAALVVQHAYANGAAPAPALTNVSAGNTLITVYMQGNAPNPVPTFSASSSLDGTFGAALVAYNPSGTSNPSCGAHRKDTVSAGAHTVTITPSSGGATIHAWLFEVSGLTAGGTVVLPTGGGFKDPAVADAHNSAPSGEIDAPAGFVVTINFLDGSVTSTAAGGAFTKAAPASTVQAFCQYKVASAAFTDDRGAWTSVGVDRISHGTMLAFPETGGGGGGGVNGRRANGWWFGL